MREQGLLLLRAGPASCGCTLGWSGCWRRAACSSHAAVHVVCVWVCRRGCRLGVALPRPLCLPALRWPFCLQAPRAPRPTSPPPATSPPAHSRVPCPPPCRASCSCLVRAGAAAAAACLLLLAAAGLLLPAGVHSSGFWLPIPTSSASSPALPLARGSSPCLFLSPLPAPDRRAWPHPHRRRRTGGQSEEEATAHLAAMNMIEGVKKPWTLSFSFGRALQARAPRFACIALRGLRALWRGDDAAAGCPATAHAAPEARPGAAASAGWPPRTAPLQGCARWSCLMHPLLRAPLPF